MNNNWYLLFVTPILEIFGSAKKMKKVLHPSRTKNLVPQEGTPLFHACIHLVVCTLVECLNSFPGNRQHLSASLKNAPRWHNSFLFDKRQMPFPLLGYQELGHAWLQFGQTGHELLAPAQTMLLQ